MRGRETFLALFLFPVIGFTQTSRQNQFQQNFSAAAQFLFKDTKIRLTVPEKNQICRDMKLALSKDGKQLLIGETSVNVIVFPTDINQDGMAEIFTRVSSPVLYGNVGENYMLFIRNGEGMLQMQPEIGAGIPLVLSNKNLGYPDIVIGVPGMNYPIYRWNGRQYKYLREIRDSELSHTKTTYIPTLSKAYTDTAQ